MSAIVGPWGWDEGLIRQYGKDVVDGSGGREVSVRVFNTNTQKTIVARFKVAKDGDYDPLGGYSIDGVPGSGSKITLSFLDPAGAKTGRGSLPTGIAVDTLHLDESHTIQASLVDVANPGVFVLASDLGLPGNVSPVTLESNAAMMAHLERIRRAGTQAMGLDSDVQSVPKIVILSPPTATDEGVNIVCRALSMQQAHKAVPLTLALNLGTACFMPGTLPWQTAVEWRKGGPRTVTIVHASGRVEVGSEWRDGKLLSALLHRTARVLMKGAVLYREET